MEPRRWARRARPALAGAAARKLAAQSAPYTALGDRPAVGVLDLVSVFATAGRRSDGLYRTRQADEVIEIYLAQAQRRPTRG